jgi:hypothetical protein
VDTRAAATLTESLVRPSARLGLAFVLAAATAEAQTLPSGRAYDDRVASAVTATSPGTRIRAQFQSTRIEGRFVRVSDNALLIDVGSADNRAIPLGDISSVWVQKKSAGGSVGKGALVGAVVFGALGAIAMKSSPNYDHSVTAAASAGVLMALPGAVAGAIVGGVTPSRSWRRVYP